MQPSLPGEPEDRNIKAADLADSADIAKIVDTAALRTDARQHPRQIPLILRSRATSSGCRFFSGTMAVPGFVASAGATSVRDDGLDRAERDKHGGRPRRILATLRHRGIGVPNRKFVCDCQRRRLVGFERNLLR